MTAHRAEVASHPIRFPLPLTRGTLVERYKRFLADIRQDDGKVTTVHCANPGSMIGLKAPGLPVVVSDSQDPRRRLRGTLEAVSVDDGGGRVWAGVNTARPNHLVAAWLEAGLLPKIPAGTPFRREVPYGARSRIDLLAAPRRGPPVYVEVKNTTLAATASDGRLEARFPDAVTERGRRHLHDMMDRVAAGDRAMLVLFVNRADAVRFAPDAAIDPDYASSFTDAVRCGVEVVPLQVRNDVRATPGGLRMTTRATGILPVRAG